MRTQELQRVDFQQIANDARTYFRAVERGEPWRLGEPVTLIERHDGELTGARSTRLVTDFEVVGLSIIVSVGPEIREGRESGRWYYGSRDSRGGRVRLPARLPRERAELEALHAEVCAARDRIGEQIARYTEPSEAMPEPEWSSWMSRARRAFAMVGADAQTVADAIERCPA